MNSDFNECFALYCSEGGGGIPIVSLNYWKEVFAFFKRKLVEIQTKNIYANEKNSIGKYNDYLWKINHLHIKQPTNHMYY